MCVPAHGHLPSSSAGCLESTNGSDVLEMVPFSSGYHQPGRLYGLNRHEDMINRGYYLAQTFGHDYLGQFRWSHVFQLNLKNAPPYPTDMIRIEFDVSRCGHFGELDAVKLTGWAAVPLPRTSSLASPPSLPSSVSPPPPLTWSSRAQFQDSMEEWPADVASLIQQFASLNPSVDAAEFFSRLLRACPSRIQWAVQQSRSSSLCVSLCNSSTPNLSIEWPYPSLADHQLARMTTGAARNPALTMNHSLALSCSDVKTTCLDLVCRSSPMAITASEDNQWESRFPNHLVPFSARAICSSRRLEGSVPSEYNLFVCLPYEILARILDHLDLRSLFRVAQLSRLFRCLVDDALSRFTSLNLQAHWSQLTDPALLSLGKRLGQVDLTSRAALAVLTNRGANCVTPYLHLLRQDVEEEARQSRPRTRASVRRALAARVRSWSTSTAEWFLAGRSLSLDHNDDHNEEAGGLSGSPPLAASQVEGGDCQRTGLPQELAHAVARGTARQRLRRLDMSWCGNYSLISPTAFRHFLGDTCRNLVTLRLSSCKFLNDDCLLFIVNTCQRLQELDLSSCVGISVTGFQMLGRLIDLRWLSVYNTQIDDSGLFALAEWCQHLRHIDIGSCAGLREADRVLHQLTRNNPNLRSINLWRCISLTPVGVQHILRSWSASLEEIDLGWCVNLSLVTDPGGFEGQPPVVVPDVACLRQLVSACRKLKKLFLAGTDLATWETLKLIGDQLAGSLEQLDISGSEEISYSAVVDLLERCPHLRLLDISCCSGPGLEHDHSAWSRLMHLRQRFPHCTLITSHRTWSDYEDSEVEVVLRSGEDAGGLVELGAVDEDGLQHYFNPFQYYLQRGVDWAGAPDVDRSFGSPALPGIGQRLALPAPQGMDASSARRGCDS